MVEINKPGLPPAGGVPLPQPKSNATQSATEAQKPVVDKTKGVATAAGMTGKHSTGSPKKLVPGRLDMEYDAPGNTPNATAKAKKVALKAPDSPLQKQEVEYRAGDRPQFNTHYQALFNKNLLNQKRSDGLPIKDALKQTEAEDTDLERFTELLGIKEPTIEEAREALAILTKAFTERRQVGKFESLAVMPGKHEWEMQLGQQIESFKYVLDAYESERRPHLEKLDSVFQRELHDREVAFKGAFKALFRDPKLLDQKRSDDVTLRQALQPSALQDTGELEEFTNALNKANPSVKDGERALKLLEGAFTKKYHGWISDSKGKLPDGKEGIGKRMHDFREALKAYKEALALSGIKQK